VLFNVYVKTYFLKAGIDSHKAVFSGIDLEIRLVHGEADIDFSFFLVG